MTTIKPLLTPKQLDELKECSHCYEPGPPPRNQVLGFASTNITGDLVNITTSGATDDFVWGSNVTMEPKAPEPPANDWNIYYRETYVRSHCPFCLGSGKAIPIHMTEDVQIA